VQFGKIRPDHVPVKVARLDVQHELVRKQTIQYIDDGLARFVGQSNATRFCLVAFAHLCLRNWKVHTLAPRGGMRIELFQSAR
jgi:hypothetical protein